MKAIAHVMRSTRPRVRCLLLALLVTGCWKAPSRFVCSSSSQCFDSGRIGVCQPSGFCSFADASCPDGQRYHSSAGALAGQCVPSDAGPGPDLATMSIADQGTPPDLAKTTSDLAVGPDLAVPPVTIKLLGSAGVPFGTTSSESESFVATAGEFVIVSVFWTATATVSVTDTLGSHYVSLPVQNNPACPVRAQLWYAENIDGGNDTLTVTVTSGATSLAFSAAGYSGVALAGSFDTSIGTTPTAATHEITAGTMTTTGANDLIVTAFADATDSGTMTPGLDYRAVVTETTFYSLLEDRANVPPGSYTPTANLPVDNGTPRMDSCWTAVAAAFRSQ